VSTRNDLCTVEAVDSMSLVDVMSAWTLCLSSKVRLALQRQI
jgi:hypothetical protein